MPTEFGPTPAATPAGATEPEVCVPASSAAPAWVAEQACCCSSRPQYRIFIGSSAGADGTADLLFCGHHFRASGPRLASLGAWVYDRTNNWVPPAAWYFES
jgi:hypothetical protein